MAPTDEITKRDYPCGYGQYLYNGICTSYGGWYYWGRWVFAGIVIIFVLFLLALCGCISSRRRRRRGMTPYYGTGWMVNGKNNGQPPNSHEMYPQQGYYQAGPPAYQPPPPQQPEYTGTSFNPGDGYYGAQQQGVQYPPTTYQRDQVYEPPAGPPPKKI